MKLQDMQPGVMYVLSDIDPEEVVIVMQQRGSVRMVTALLFPGGGYIQTEERRL